MKKKEEAHRDGKTSNRNQYKISKTRVRDLAHSIYQDRIRIGYADDAESDCCKAEEELYRQ